MRKEVKRMEMLIDKNPAEEARCGICKDGINEG
jgi:hypothetical protein